MLTLVRCKSQSGFTFVELMVALAVNVILLTALLGLLAANLNRYNNAVAISTLNEQLQSAMQFMVNDIRRAGYWSNASSNIGTSGSNNNPFQASAADLTVNSSCILFTYDHNGTGTLPSIASGSDDDRYGFMLNGTVIQTRPPGATYACNATNWENVTNSNIVKITGLSFSLSSVNVPAGASSPPYMTLRTVTITLTGQLTHNSAVTASITQNVRIRNDKYVP